MANKNIYLECILKKLQEGNIRQQDAYDLIKSYRQEQQGLRRVCDIAIVGVACRYADADDKTTFWECLINGRDSVGTFPPSRRADTDDLLGINAQADKNAYCYGSFFQDISSFDHEFFHIPYEEASVMDPQHRVFLETAYHAIEDAGHLGARRKTGSVGVFVGNVGNEFIRFLHQASRDAVSGNATAFLPGRVSFCLDLSGPSMMLNTACSSSLVAVHEACQSLQNGSCAMAVAGGITIFHAPIQSQEPWEMLGITSASQRCKAFDDRADGIVRGEGCGAVVLKRIDDALADGDHIYATIKGSAINQDGHSNGLTSPNPLAQASVLEQAWSCAGINPEDIGYLEAHGTGTRLGDPIEISAMRIAFSKHTQNKQFCAVGSSKTNVGHLSDGAGGITALIKVVLSIYHKKIPPSLHFYYPNDLAHFINAPVYLQTKLGNWPNPEKRLAGVSAFGLSGTNAHVVLQGVDDSPGSHAFEVDSPHLLTISSNDGASVIGMIERYIQCFRHSPDDFRDICYSANMAKEHHPYRIALVAASRAEFIDLLCELRESSLDINALKLNTVYYGRMYQNQVADQDARHQVEKAAVSYVRGDDITWSELYASTSYRYVPTVNYLFKKKRCWPKSDININGNFVAKTTLRLEDASDDIEISVIPDAGERFVAICNKILCKTDLTLDSHFFQMGGNSIKVIELINNIKKHFGFRLAIDTVFENPVLGAIFSRLEHEQLASAESIPIVDCKSEYVVSFAQKRIYFVSHLQPNSTVNNINGTVRILGQLDIKRFERTLQQLVARHEGFRTFFVTKKSGLVQKIDHELTLPLTTITCANEAEAIARIEGFVRPFVLETAPLIRVAVLEVSDTLRYMVFDVHHMICDGSSLGLLVRDFVALYADKPLEPLPISYKDYAQWQMDTYQEKKTKQKAYWLDMHRQPREELKLPYDHQRGSKMDYAGSAVHIDISGSTHANIKKFCLEKGYSLNSLCISALYILLFNVTGQRDITVGMISAGRNHDALQNLVGVFINTLPLRTNIDINASVTAFVAKVQRMVNLSLDHQDYQFNDLVHELGIRQVGSFNPLFNVAFVLQNMAYPKLKAEGLTFEPLQMKRKTSQFDIRVEVWEEEHPASLTVYFEYRDALFESDTIETMASLYENLLIHIATGCGKVIRELFP